MSVFFVSVCRCLVSFILLFNKSTQDSDMSLYKYMSGTGAIRLFRSGMLRFTQPIEFNDPFEMQPFLKGLADKPTLENQFHANFAKNLDPQIDDMLTKTQSNRRAKIQNQSSRHSSIDSVTGARSTRNVEYFCADDNSID